MVKSELERAIEAVERLRVYFAPHSDSVWDLDLIMDQLEELKSWRDMSDWV